MPLDIKMLRDHQGDYNSSWPSWGEPEHVFQFSSTIHTIAVDISLKTTNVHSCWRYRSLEVWSSPSKSLGYITCEIRMSECWNISQDKWKLWPGGGARWTVRESPKSVWLQMTRITDFVFFVSFSLENHKNLRGTCVYWNENVKLMVVRLNVLYEMSLGVFRLRFLLYVTDSLPFTFVNVFSCQKFKGPLKSKLMWTPSLYNFETATVIHKTNERYVKSLMLVYDSFVLLCSLRVLKSFQSSS